MVRLFILMVALVALVGCDVLDESLADYAKTKEELEVIKAELKSTDSKLKDSNEKLESLHSKVAQLNSRVKELANKKPDMVNKPFEPKRVTKEYLEYGGYWAPEPYSNTEQHGCYDKVQFKDGKEYRPWFFSPNYVKGKFTFRGYAIVQIPEHTFFYHLDSKGNKEWRQELIYWDKNSFLLDGRTYEKTDTPPGKGC